MAIKDSVDSFPSEVLDGRASIDIKNEIDRLRADQHELIFYSQFYVKKVQNDCQTRLENNSEKIDKMQDMLGIVLRKENAEQQLQRKLGATWVDISDMTTLFLTGLRDYSLDRDEQRFLDMMQGSFCIYMTFFHIELFLCKIACTNTMYIKFIRIYPSG